MVSVINRSHIELEYRITYKKGLRGALNLKWQSLQSEGKNNGKQPLILKLNFQWYCWISNHNLFNNQLYLPSCISMANCTSSSSDNPDDAVDVKLSSRLSSSMLVFKLEVEEDLPRESSLSALRIFMLQPLTLLPKSSIDRYWQIFARPRLLIAPAHAHSLFWMSA